MKGYASTEEFIESDGGVRIFTRSWRPSSSPRAVVVICHGLNSHGGQYLWPAEQLVDNGFVVYALDLRGRGKSEGKRFYVEDVDDYVDDVDAVVRLARSRNPDLPIFLLGHSAGGVVSCVFTLEHESELAGLICESFAFEVPSSHLVLGAIKALSRVAPNLPVYRLKNEVFSRDPEAVERLKNDPLTAGEREPASTVAAFTRADERLELEFKRIHLPVLIMHGTDDRVTVPAGSQFFYEHVGSQDKTLMLYDGHFHDLLNDFGKESVMSDITQWIDQHLQAA